jgi:hypothetical protein
MNILEKIIFKPLPETQYLREPSSKNQIYLHHTASSPNPYGVLEDWALTPPRIGTAFIIGGKPDRRNLWKDGDIVQAFSSKFWAWHLGLTNNHLRAGGPRAKTNTELNKNSIGIEICNWGQLTLRNGKFINYVGREVNESEVIELSYRGHRYFQRYTEAQIEATYHLLKYLGQTWNIPLKYKGDRIFNICPEALQGESGVWTHTSVRPDKVDCFPQPELIQMLNSL